MNCRKDDLALVIAGASTGVMVTCLELLPAGWQRDDLPRGFRQRLPLEAGPLWRVDRPIQWENPDENRRYGISTVMHVIPDYALMPIRPDADPKSTADVRRERFTA